MPFCKYGWSWLHYKMDIDLLPTELKLHIFSFLTHTELCEKVALVSEPWRILTLSPYVQKKLIVKNKYYSSESAILDDYKKYARILHVKFANISTWSWLSSIQNHNYLRVLEFTTCRIQSKQSLAQILEKTPNLQSIKIIRCKFTNNDCFTNMPHCTHLKSIHLVIRHHEYCSRHCNCLDFIIQHRENLQELTLRSNSHIDESLLREFLEGNNTLRKLTVNFKYLTSRSLLTLDTCRELTHLSLFEFICGGLDKYSLVISWESQLESIALIKSDLSVVGFDSFLTWNSFSNLHTFHIARCKYFNGSLALLLAKRCPFLKVLTIANCRDLTDEVIQVVIDRCSLLERLDVRGYSFGSTFRGSFLTDISFKLPHLKYLNLTKCFKIPKDRIIKLKVENPGITVRTGPTKKKK